MPQLLFAVSLVVALHLAADEDEEGGEDGGTAAAEENVTKPNNFLFFPSQRSSLAHAVAWLQNGNVFVFISLEVTQRFHL